MPRKQAAKVQESKPKPAGRPSTYQDCYADQAAKLCKLGATDAELADFFGVSIRQIHRWRTRHPAFGEAGKQGKGEHDNQRVERALYHRALGYSFETEKIFQYQGQIVRAPVMEHVPPDPGALQFWLTNRHPDEWRSRQELTGANGGPIAHIDVSALTPVERMQRIAAIMQANGGAGPVIDGKANKPE